MQQPAVRFWLIDIRTEIAGIRELTANVELAAFADSWGMRRAVEHGLLIIAEAAKHLPLSLKEVRPEVPWEKIHGLGNLLRHEYRRIDPEILWSIVTDHLGPLDSAVTALLERIDSDSSQT
jgi:uncharacterized protein with HEPN domain